MAGIREMLASQRQAILNGQGNINIPPYHTHTIREMIGNALHNYGFDQSKDQFYDIDNQQERRNFINNRIRNYMLDGIPWAKAVNQAKKDAEEKRPQLWSNNDKPKESGNPTSSVVRAVVLNPDNSITVNIAGTNYKYSGGATPELAMAEMKKLIESPSLGRDINRYDPTSWGSRHRLAGY